MGAPAVLRNEKGHILPGQKLGLGNKGGKARQAALRRTLVNAVTPEKIIQAEQKLFQMFMDGEVMAGKVWFDQVLGRPPAAVTIEGGIDNRLSVQLVLAAIREVIPDRETQEKLADAFERMTSAAALPAPKGGGGGGDIK